MDNEKTENIEITKEPGFTFRKAVGGFKKEDVIKYISEENRKFAAERDELNGKLAEQTAKAEAAAKKSSELQLYYELLLKKRSEELAEKDAELQAAAKRAQEVENKEKTFNDEIEKFREAAVKANEDADKARMDAAEANDAAQKACAEAEERLKELTASYEEKIGALEAKCASLESELGEARSDFEKKNAECFDLFAKCANLEAELKDARACGVPADDGAAEALRGELADLQSKFDELTAKYEEALRSAEEPEKAPVPEEVPEKEDRFESVTPEPAREFARQLEGSPFPAQKKAEDENAENAEEEEIKEDFGPCLDDLSGSISRLLKEIAHRCSLLAAYVEMKADSEEIARKIKRSGK